LLIKGCGFKVINDFVLLGKDSFEYWTSKINFISDILYALYPEYFFPYVFHGEYYKFQNICQEFEIPIPPVPKKKDWESRAMFYIEICESLLEFRKFSGLSPGELGAFLYDFALNVIDHTLDNEMPKPSKAWFVGANKNNFDFLDKADKFSWDYWQGNLEAKRGDIVVIYCLSPRSYIHSIWRVDKDGFADPFFYFYNAVAITLPIKLQIRLTHFDLKSNPVWVNNSLVRKNLQGINGYPIKYNEYQELLSMLEIGGQRVFDLPKLELTSRLETDELKDEREVEIQLIEPLLVLLGYEFSDWIRQMPVKMGRGERYYPDYCFGANPVRGEEYAKLILESKLEIRTKKDLKEAYFQAKSYALRLQAQKFIIASKEGVWIYQSQNGSYIFDEYFNCNWIQIENPDMLYELKRRIGKSVVLGK
jgi:hypothetical protein